MDQTETVAEKSVNEPAEVATTNPPEGAPETLPAMTPEKVYAAVAGKVRSDSQNLAIPIPVEELGPLFPDLTPEQIVAHLTELVQKEEYADIKVMTSATGASYLYSETSIKAEDASAKVLADETLAAIATRVRENSKDEARLTPAESLEELFPDLAPGQVEKYLAEMGEKDKFQDIKQLAGPNGVLWLYSERSMTSNYAALLARVEAKDPCKTIAETVREESRTYPRPTKVTLFYDTVFQIDGINLEGFVERTLQQPEYKDIKKIVASTSAVYLYSDLYMPAGQAEYLVEWEEIGKYKSP
ncbi:MAG: hypothetical protein ACM3S0_03885 [Acidobacteriota bacterium]